MKAIMDKIKKGNPFYLAGGIFVLLLIIFVIQWIARLVAGDAVDRMDIWKYVFGAGVVYSIFAAIGLVASKNLNRYYNLTLLSFLGLLALAILVGTLVSGENIFVNTTYRRVFFFAVLEFTIMTSLAILLRKVEQWTRKYDQNFLNDD